jgi:hypothetical protein
MRRLISVAKLANSLVLLALLAEHSVKGLTVLLSGAPPGRNERKQTRVGASTEAAS